MQTLEQWLSIATRGLCDSAAARVRAEIQDHYLTATEAAGRGGPDAEARAVAALGDAAAANREYRRVLLTRGEDIILRSMLKGPARVAGISDRRQFWGRALAAFLTLQALAFLTLQTARGSALIYLVGALILSALMQHHLPVGSVRAGWAIRLVRWGVMAGGVVLAVVNGVGVSPLVAVPAWLAYQEYRRFVLRRKLPLEQWPAALYN